MAWKLCLAWALFLAAAAAVPRGAACRSLRGEPDPERRAGGPAVLRSDLTGAAEPGSALPPARAGTAAAAAAATWPDRLLAGYLSNEQLEAWTADYVARCGSIARRFSLGKSGDGADLWVVEIAAHPGKVEAKPNFKYVANMHGDEPGGRMLLPQLAEWLCANQATDRRARRIVQGMHLFLLPTMNPDGFARSSRYNAAGADLNRNFPSPFVACRGQAPQSCGPAQLASAAALGRLQPEAAAVAAWTLDPDFPFTAAANLHEGAVVVNIPWDGYDDGSDAVRGDVNPAPDFKAFEFMARKYASTHASMSNSPNFIDGTTNGAAWYPVYGSMQDWNYAAAGCMDVTLELNDQKYPPARVLPGMWHDNADALIALPIAAVLGGASGRVTGADGATPVPGASVSVVGIDRRGVAAHRATGYFNQPLAPGSYTLRAAAPGYRSAALSVVVPADGSGAQANFKLRKCRRDAACGA